MNTGEVTQRIAMLEARFSGLRSGRGRGGGRVGAAMEGALASASARAGSSVGSGQVRAPVSPATAAPVSAPTQAPPSQEPPSPSAGRDPAWASRLPSAGRPWASAIATAADEHGLDQRLLAALVWTESGFDPAARSPAGAIGLGQLMPGTAAELGVDPTDPQQNLDGAARYLRTQLDRFGDVKLALAAYNAGPGRVAAAGGVPRIAETTAYVARVTERATTLGA